MTELILGKNKDSFSKNREGNVIMNKINRIQRESINNKDGSRPENYNSEIENLFNNKEKAKNQNELDQMNENFNDINEISVSEKTDNISNISGDRNNFKSNFLQSQKLVVDREKNKEDKDGDGVDKENKPRFAISHKLSNQNNIIHFYY